MLWVCGSRSSTRGNATCLRRSHGAWRQLSTCAGLGVAKLCARRRFHRNRKGGVPWQCLFLLRLGSWGWVHLGLWQQSDDGVLRGELLGREVPRAGSSVSRIGQGGHAAVQRSAEQPAYFSQEQPWLLRHLGDWAWALPRGVRWRDGGCWSLRSLLCLLRLPRLSSPRSSWAVGGTPCPAQCSGAH